METKLIMCFLCYYMLMAMCCCFGNIVHAIESPKYTVIQSESDFQIRLYNESSSWMSALSSSTSFEQSTKSGFHRFLLYFPNPICFMYENRTQIMLSHTTTILYTSHFYYSDNTSHCIVHPFLNFFYTEDQ